MSRLPSATRGRHGAAPRTAPAGSRASVPTPARPGAAHRTAGALDFIGTLLMQLPVGDGFVFRRIRNKRAPTPARRRLSRLLGGAPPDIVTNLQNPAQGGPGTSPRLPLGGTDAGNGHSRLARIVEVTDDAVISIDSRQNITYFNPAAERIFGYRSDEILGQSLEILMPERFRGRHRAHVDNFAGQETPARRMQERSEIIGCRKGGYEFPAEASILKFEWDGEVVLTAVLRDISHVKAQESALHESERRYAAIFEQGALGVCQLTLEGRYIAANRRFCEIVGYTAEELRGCSIFEMTESADLADDLSQTANLIEGSSGACVLEKRLLSKDGSPRWVNRNLTVVRKDSGEPECLIAVVDDISDYRKMEERLRFAKEQAETANRMKSKFLANMSHELRTPLNAIIGFSQLMERQTLGTLGDPRYADYAKYISEAGRHLLDVINDVLDMAKIEAGKVELSETEVDIGELVRSTARLMAEAVSGAGLTLRLALPDDLPPVRGDRRLIRQMILNLLSNAIKFTPSGGILTVHGRADEGCLKLTVADTGIGMAPHEIRHALEPFGQLDNHPMREKMGTGLGLPLVKSLIELHGGRLHLKSRIGAGTAVSLSFPSQLVICEAAGPEKPGAPVSAARRAKVGAAAEQADEALEPDRDPAPAPKRARKVS